MKATTPLLTSLLFVLAIGVTSVSAFADSLTIDLDQKFSGGAVVPELTITFEDMGPNTVYVTMSGTSMAANECVQDWYFNYDGNASTELTFSDVDTADVLGLGNITIVQASAQDQQADGDGCYNLWLQFQNSNGPGQFTNDETIVLAITGTGLTAGDFDLLAMPGGNHGPFFSAAQIGGGTGWIGAGSTDFQADDEPVPEPGTWALLCLGLALVGLGRLRLTR